LVIILGVKTKLKFKFFKSMKLWIILIMIVVGIIPCIILRGALLSDYEKRAVSLKTAEIQNQCTILSNQMAMSQYLSQGNSEVIDAELTQFSNINNGRVMIVDEEFRILKDTYDMDTNKTLVSEDVIRCFKGKGTSRYDGKNRYIEVTAPISAAGSDKIEGVMLVSVATDYIVDSLYSYQNKAELVIGTVFIVICILAFFLATLLVQPFKRLTKQIGTVTEGYGTEEIRENAYLETIKIADAMNQMLLRWKTLDDSRQEFVSNVSHELKTPLTSMKVLADSLLMQEDVPTELYKEFMGDIAQEIERESKIINDLLSLVKMDKNSSETMNVKSEDINALVEMCLKRLRPIAVKENIELIFESIRPVTAEVDEMKLSLAISNLVENAIKYNQEQGHVRVFLDADYKYFYLKVEDSGIGIPQEAQNHIFERFYRVDKSHSKDIGGTGLGLAIARSAIVMHRGAIKVYSEVGKGTTFTLRIPLTYVV